MPVQTPKTAQTPIVLLVPTAAIAAFGLGLLALTATMPLPDLPDLPPPGTSSTVSSAVAASPATAGNISAAEQPALWPALFGHPAPEPTPAPPPEPEPEPEDYEPEPYEYDTDHYILRGLVSEEGGGWALLETDTGVIVVGVGDILPEGETVTQILGSGIEIDADGTFYFLSFDDSDPGNEQDYQPPEPQEIAEPSRPPRRQADPRHTPPDPSSAPRRNRFGIGEVGR